ncbi:hypothetical protein [Chryseobacterium shigense]|uniref:Uncharacterized protein n=1 Tax=Chryseobacterium shigense TaxID=297244 RepID=A0A841NP90_9FLAO|nr:hypothetical protein [Chryseobacterium shigense]MBB6372545.1 hypothetical protein [Chryseobacterium shigense]
MVIKKNFDNPQSVWLNSFETSLNKFSKYTLLVLATLGTPVLLTDLEIAVESFFVKNSMLGASYEPMIFEKSVRELENTFIKTDIDKMGNFIIEYQNPSIYDFLLYYLDGKNRIINILISSFVFIDQFQTIFSGQELPGKIMLNNDQIKIIGDRIFDLEDNLKTCKVYRNNNYGDKFEFVKSEDYLYQFLNYLNNNYSEKSESVMNFIYRNFDIKFDHSSYKSEYIQLLHNLDLTRFEFEEERLISDFFIDIETIEELEIFDEFGLLFPTTYEKWINSEHFAETAYYIIRQALEDITGEDVFYYQPIIETISRIYPLDLSDELKFLEDKAEDHDRYVDHQIEMANDREFDDYDYSDISDDVIIEEIFNSLKE